ncbi:hypothetical protein [Geotalea sp. SG265]|uniref:hypothetical protein n=1 Tax=Geotalea sp. SG265 TaxID=2922867 RepID=UPI001FB00AC7|nr:hypothetical protein [Geotalea sp. SG265]
MAPKAIFWATGDINKNIAETQALNCLQFKQIFLVLIKKYLRLGPKPSCQSHCAMIINKKHMAAQSHKKEAFACFFLSLPGF